MYTQKIESHFKQVKQTWSGLKKITEYSTPKSHLPSDLDLNELNQFYARFDAIDVSTVIADERMELKVSKVCG